MNRSIKLVYMKGQEISAYEAKTHLPRLLRDAEVGASYLIRRRGKPVARLTPVSPPKRRCDYRDLAASFRRLRKSMRRPLKVGDLVEEGRRL